MILYLIFSEWLNERQNNSIEKELDSSEENSGDNIQDQYTSDEENLNSEWKLSLIKPIKIQPGNAGKNIDN